MYVIILPIPCAFLRYRNIIVFIDRVTYTHLCTFRAVFCADLVVLYYTRKRYGGKSIKVRIQFNTYIIIILLYGLIIVCAQCTIYKTITISIPRPRARDLKRAVLSRLCLLRLAMSIYILSRPENVSQQKTNNTIYYYIILLRSNTRLQQSFD